MAAKVVRFVFVMLVVGVLLLMREGAPRTSAPTPVAPEVRFPVVFEANRGQTDAEAKFLSRAPGATMFLTQRGAVLSSHGKTVRMELVGAHPEPRLEGVEKLPGKRNYFVGKDPAGWCTDVPTYRGVRYREVYDGIDLVFHSGKGQLEYDFVVAPGADPNQIALHFEVDEVSIDRSGDLVLNSGDRAVRHRKPHVYQDDRVVAGEFVRHDSGDIGFRVGDYDRTRPLVIDPVIAWSTFVGGSQFDSVRAMALGAGGSIYVAGETASLDFPTENPAQGSVAGSGDAWVAKISADGQTLEYATYIGGSSYESINAIAVDAAGQAHATGYTLSSDFPTTSGTVQQSLNGSRDAFVIKLGAAGDALAASSYLGGGGWDAGWALALDSSGSVYMGGYTGSTDFPGAGTSPIQPALSGNWDAFVAKLNPDLGGITYATYLGGSNERGVATEFVYGIAVDGAGQAYAVGWTNATDFPTVNALQPNYGGGPDDCIVTKINATGSAIEFSTYLGGQGLDFALQVKLGPDGGVWLTGITDSPDYPSVKPLQAHAGGLDAFLSKLSSDGATLEFSTHYGGAGNDRGNDIAVDAVGNVYLGGLTTSADFPVVRALQPDLGGVGAWNYGDGFVVRIDADLARVDYATYLGGSGDESETKIAIDGSGNLVVSGLTDGGGFPIANAIQPTFGGVTDGYVTRIELSDSDGDGLPDIWEMYGYHAPDGSFVDLPSMGAHPDHKDIFVEIDYMAGQMPSQAALDLVVAAFAAAPVDNPDGIKGIKLHCLVGDEILFAEYLGGESTPGAYDWQGDDPNVTYFQEIKDASSAESLAPVAHYCLFAHKLDFGDRTVSGISRGSTATGYAASEFIVSLGGVGVGGIGSVNQQAGTFMHELGHDLGLRHGGGDSTNKKPNYLSIMNHAFQMSGLVGGGFNYSCCKLPDLNENSQLDEQIGLNGGGLIAGLGTKWQCGGVRRTTANANGPIDWNCNDAIDTVLVAADINGDLLPIGPIPAPVLVGHNDWANIVFQGGAIGALGSSELPPPPPPAATEPPEEVNEEIVAALGLPAPTGLKGHPTDPQTTLTWSPVAAPGGGSVTYNVYRIGAGGVELLANIARTNYHDKTAAAGTEYKYSIASVDEFETEGPTASVMVTTR